MADVALRPATLADSKALFALHRASLGWGIEEIYGPWDEDVQHRFHERWFDPDRVWVIEHGEEIAGLLDYTFHEDRLTIARIQLHPSYQGAREGHQVHMRRAAGGWSP